MKNKYTLLFVLLASFVFMSAVVDLNDLFNYENQDTPAYIIKDNTPANNLLTDKGVTLGRVLFYDKQLSVDNTIACASCHLQEFAFGDTAVVSTGVNGVTGRHSMRLVNARFSNEARAFWDERASSFEDQSTKPIQDHVEMGYSGENGDPGFDVLIDKLEAIDYYAVLFEFVYGDTEITEEKIQKAIAQFIRSMESYDAKFDDGLAQVNNNIQTPFPNFTAAENMGKDLFFTHPPLGGAGCARCHNGPEFSMIPVSQNNGVIGVANDPTAFDLIVTKAPSLRDLVNPAGMMNGPFMHDGSLHNLTQVVNHYNDLGPNPDNPNLDFRLAGPMHDLDLSDEEKEALIAFLRTLTGVEIYTNEKWSSPFDEEGNITVIPLDPNGTVALSPFDFELSPNPTTDKVTIQLAKGNYQLAIFDINGIKVKSSLIQAYHVEDLSILPSGTYFIQIHDLFTQKIFAKKVIKK